MFVATLTFLAFVAYGKLSPATYQATARIVLKATGERPLVLAGPGNPADRLRQAALSDQSLDKVALELGLGTGPGARLATEQQLRGRLDVTPTGPGTFDVTVRASTALSTQRIANVLARGAAQRATVLFGNAPPDEATAKEAARAKSANDLAKLMADHPELTPTPIVTPVSAKDAAEAQIPALRAERDQLQSKLDRIDAAAASGSSDNPFGDGPAIPSAEINRMRRRLAEIDQTLVARRKADRKNEQSKKVAPEVEREWKRLLKEVANPTVTLAPPSESGFTVAVLEATLPSAPIHPEPHRVAFVGGAVSALLGLLVGFAHARSIAKRRRRESVRPQHPASDPPRFASEPPPYRGSEPPLLTSGSPRPASDPPRPASDPPRPASDPPRPASDRPRPASDPPRPASDPPRPASDPPRPGSDPPGIAAGRGSDPASPGNDATQLKSLWHSSSNPPARPGSDPVPARAITAVTATSGNSSSKPPAPAEGTGSGAASPGTRVRRVTQVGLGALSLEVAPKPDIARRGAAAGDDEPFQQSPSARVSASELAPAARQADGPSSTLRPPPPDAPAPETAKGFALVDPSRQSGPPAAGESDESWTGPSRAHRRTVSARRTTLVMGSPIPPDPPRGRPSSSNPPADNARPTPRPNQSSTGYSYVSERPEGRPAETPPYYFSPDGQASNAARGPSKHHRPDPRAPTRLSVQPVPGGWSPDHSLDLHRRRELSDQIFPLAIERCFTVAVIAVPEVRAHKSRVAAELALALAEPQHPRILLMEADFQWPAVAHMMQIEMPFSQGLSSQLRARTQQPNAPWTVVGCGPTLHVLAEGLMRSPAMLLTAQFEDGLKSLQAQYDIIVLDGPDTASEVDCRALGSLVQGVVCLAPPEGSPSLGRVSESFQDVRFSSVIGI